MSKYKVLPCIRYEKVLLWIYYDMVSPSISYTTRCCLASATIRCNISFNIKLPFGLNTSVYVYLRSTVYTENNIHLCMN